MDIKIKNKKEKDSGWDVEVELEGSDFTVEVDKPYWKDLTDEKIEPEELVKKSFEFLLERESKSSILRNFNLRVISEYFPDYEDKISI